MKEPERHLDELAHLVMGAAIEVHRRNRCILSWRSWRFGGFFGFLAALGLLTSGCSIGPDAVDDDLGGSATARFKTDPAAEEAALQEIRSLSGTGDLNGTCEKCREFLDRYPGSARRTELAELWMKAALKLLGGEGSFWSAPRTLGKKHLRALLEQCPFEDVSDDAAYLLARHLREEGSLDEAVLEYDALAKTYPDSSWVQEAILAIGEIRFAKYRGASYDAASLRDARAAYERYLEEYPRGPHEQEIRARLRDVEERQAERLSGLAFYHLQRGERGAAVIYLEEILRRFPACAVSAQARQELALVRTQEGQAASRELAREGPEVAEP